MTCASAGFWTWTWSNPASTTRRSPGTANACCDAHVSRQFFDEVVVQADRLDLLSDEHFTVDGTLIEAAASLKSFRPKDEPPTDAGELGRQPGQSLGGLPWRAALERHAPEPHRSGCSVVQERRGASCQTVLRRACRDGESAWPVGGLPGHHRERHRGMCGGAPVDGRVEGTSASIPRRSGWTRATTRGTWSPNCAPEHITPHVAQNTAGRRSAIDGRTTRHAGYAISQRIRMKVEEIFGWMKTVGGFRKTRYRGLEKVDFAGYLVGAAYNLVRLARLVATPTPA